MSRVQVPSPAPFICLVMNLKVSVKDIKSCEKMLTIDVSEEAVSNEFASFYDTVAKRAKIPGFRPGHAPRSVVALHYREEARRWVLDQLLMQSFREAVAQEKIPVIGEPAVHEIQFDESHLKFNAHVETRPKIKLDKYVGLSLTHAPIQVKEPEVEEMIKRLQEARAKFVAVEDRLSGHGDFLIFDYTLAVDGTEVEKREGEWIELRERDLLEGFSKQLVGSKPGEMRQVVTTFPTDFGREEWRGKSGVFSVTVREIKEKRLLPLDDEFAKETGEYSTLGELKDAVRQDLEAEKNKANALQLERDLMELLLTKSHFDVPAPMVQRCVARHVEQEIRALVAQGRKPEELKKEQENLKERLRPAAEREVRIAFVLDEVARREGISATDTDLEAKYAEISRRSRRPIEQVKTFFHKDEGRHEELMIQVRQEKTVQWMKDRAKIKEVVSKK